MIDAIDIIREKKDTMMVGSGNVFQVLNSTVNMNLATIFSLKGINFTVSAACASGSHAIGLAAMFIRNGMQDCIICGGAQEINKFSMGNFDALGAFSIREHDPKGPQDLLTNIATDWFRVVELLPSSWKVWSQHKNEAQEFSAKLSATVFHPMANTSRTPVSRVRRVRFEWQ